MGMLLMPWQDHPFAYADGERLLQVFPPALWLRADHGITLVGSKVSAWASKEGAGLAVTQSTDDNRPLFVESAINGKPALDFDGSNDYLLDADGTPLQGTDGDVFAVVKTGAPSGSDAFFSIGNTGSNVEYLWAGILSSKFRLLQDSNDTDDSLAGTAATSSNPTIYRFGSNGESYFAEVNGAADALTAMSGTDSGDWEADISGVNSFAVGCRDNGSLGFHWHGYIAEIIGFKRRLPDNMAAAIHAYLGQRYGISV